MNDAAAPQPQVCPLGDGRVDRPEARVVDKPVSRRRAGQGRST